MKKPIIGITLDAFDPLENEKAAWFSSYEYWYALRSSYADAIINAGGIPFLLPHHNECIHDFIKVIDGLMITGGGFDVPPSYYGCEKHEKTRLKLRRSTFEKELFETFYAYKKPILGICGGMQLITALRGGKLYQYLPEMDFKPHLQTTLAKNPWHTVKCVEGTFLSKILDNPVDYFPVNSVHQQAVSDPGDLVVCGYSDDHLIEAVEDKSHPFCIGVQWHPELIISDYDSRIFKRFIQIC